MPVDHCGRRRGRTRGGETIRDMADEITYQDEHASIHNNNNNNKTLFI